MGLGKHAFPRGRGRHRNAEQLGELSELGPGLAHAHAVAGDDDGLRGLVQQLQGMANAFGSGGRSFIQEVRCGVVEPWRGVWPGFV